MDCLEAREELWPPERPRLCGADVARAREHVDACEECRRYFAQDRALLDAYDGLRARQTPREVRERVFDALARARLEQATARPPARFIERPAVVGAAVAIAASAMLFGAVFLVRHLPEAVDDPAIFAEDYLRRAVAEDQIISSDPQEVRRFLQRELGMGVAPLQVVGLELERAEVCLIRGRRGALIVYMSEAGPISHYLVPWDGIMIRAPAVASYRDASPVDRMPVVTWSTPDLEQALVGDVAAAELLRLAALGAG